MSITHCFDEYLILYQANLSSTFSNPSFEHWLIDFSNNEKVPIIAARPLNYISNTYYLRASASKAAIEFCSPMFCIVDGTKLVFPVILDMVLEDEDEL